MKFGLFLETMYNILTLSRYNMQVMVNLQLALCYYHVFNEGRGITSKNHQEKLKYDIVFLFRQLKKTLMDLCLYAQGSV